MMPSSKQGQFREEPTQVHLRLAHSPDSDDAFMFYALATSKILTGNLTFTHVLEDIESLNQKALQGIYDITAISFHAYAYVADRYVLLPSGASFGDRYGPIVVARDHLGREGLKGKRVAVPGKMTTSYLALQLYEPTVEPLMTPFDQVLDCVARGEADAGVVIHEGQLTYPQTGLTKVLDLGEWWYGETQLPLPLGGNAILRSLDGPTRMAAAQHLRESIEYALEHREEAMTYAQRFARGADLATANRFVSMYVNEWTTGYSERGRRAVQSLLDQGFAEGLLPRAVKADYVQELSAPAAKPFAQGLRD
jgi:5,8-dihydroxy-2-naphthoate synthase